ncbi:PRC-barrel domain-containing protein [Solimicrobium silvestre]|uniref:PRC-barrel domain n=1 Tax=Solimicrobium silvestre TaxID=2099400 RepID=A0A2S9GW44_9BURK|nr:PRC-barrel domain-containing protein [Solimicrobium silvestre]PRC91943.1 PRC-barrel domain [Solimicrobium silvestre]
MLRNSNEFINCAISATDGAIGHIENFYFDDKTWVVRYLIVDTGNWLFSRKVLISPRAVEQVNWENKTISVNITKEQVKSSPNIDTEKPVSRQHEMTYNGYYGYPYYWEEIGLWGIDDYPPMMMPIYTESLTAPLGVEQEIERSQEQIKSKNYDPHLRSYKEIETYRILTSDGEIGHVKGLLIDEENWIVRYIIVDTTAWWPSQGVLIEIQRIKEVNWADNTIHINLTQQSIIDAPPYDSKELFNQEKEMGLKEHYQRLGYRIGE